MELRTCGCNKPNIYWSDLYGKPLCMLCGLPAYEKNRLSKDEWDIEQEAEQKPTDWTMEMYPSTHDGKSGQIVKSKSGVGRTYNEKGLIDDKVPVYLVAGRGAYESEAILCDPKSLELLGFID